MVGVHMAVAPMPLSREVASPDQVALASTQLWPRSLSCVLRVHAHRDMRADRVSLCACADTCADRVCMVIGQARASRDREGCAAMARSLICHVRAVLWIGLVTRCEALHGPHELRVATWTLCGA